jgi:hypothetical protein
MERDRWSIEKARTDKRSLWIYDKQHRLGTSKACVAVANKVRSANRGPIFPCDRYEQAISRERPRETADNRNGR